MPLSPAESAHALAYLGVAQTKNGRAGAAIATYREAIALDPQPSTLINLARVEREVGHLDEAIVAFERALELRPNLPEAWSMLSNALREAGRLDDALAAARRALEQNPWLGDGHLNEGVALHSLGKLSDAAVSYLVASTLTSSCRAGAGNLRVALADARLRDESNRCTMLDWVRRLAEAPGDATAWRCLGRSVRAAERPGAALCCLERAAELAPEAATLLELGALSSELGHLRRARAFLLAAFDCTDAGVETYRRIAAWALTETRVDLVSAAWYAVLERCPDDVFSLVNLGLVLQRQGRPSQAARLQQRAIELCPDAVQAHANLGSALADQGRFDEANAAFRRGLALEPRRASLASNVLHALHFDPRVSPQASFDEHVAFGRRFGEPVAPERRPFPEPRDPERRLRVGYVSPDLRWHPVAYFLEPVLGQHDPEAIDVHCYSDVEQPDLVTARLAGRVPHFVDCARWSDAELAERIAADQIDILVDLAGHTANNRLPMFALRPAPIQVSWLGYCGTTGLRAIDYRLADEHSVPPAAERWFVERIVRLPRSQSCFSPPPGPEPALRAPCLGRGHVTFGCFNNPAKVTRAVVAAFARILRRLPQSRLVLEYGSYQDPLLGARYESWFQAEGIERHRLALAGHRALPRFLASISEVDVALDPFPHSGETTALHALWMGVPVVALEGPTLVQRLASRVLRVAGLDAWVAGSEDEYVRIALALGADPEALGRARQGLRERLMASPLLDHAGFTRELEAAYRTMWRTWCRGEAGRELPRSDPPCSGTSGAGRPLRPV
jgi:protein O-GlcNAc transferase